MTLLNLGWPRVPLLLGLVLGSLAESRFFVSMDAYGTSWLVRPGVLVLGSALVVSLLIPGRGSRPPLAAAEMPDEFASGRDGTRTSLLFLMGLTAILAAGLLVTSELPARAALFPRLVLAATLLLTMTQAVRSCRITPVRSEANPVASSPLSPNNHAVVIWIGLFVVSIWILGFVVGAPLAVLLYLLITARQQVWRAGLMAGGAYLFMEVCMVRILGSSSLRARYRPGPNSSAG